MVLVNDFDDFYQRAVLLYRSDPSQVRYVMKYRHCDGNIVFKVTSDTTCISFTTVEASDLKKLEVLNLLFFGEL
jgi:signal recognition particle subunit SRP9